MRETTRTFIAIPMPDAVGRQLARWQQALQPEVPGCRWIDGQAQPLHMTLAFLGDVPNRDLNDLCLAVAEAVAPCSRFELTVEGLGAFPDPARPRVVWAGVTAADPGPLDALRQAVVQAVTDCGYRPDDMRFHPHVTLGRFKPGRGRPCDLTEIIRRGRDRPAGSFPVAEVVIFASTLEKEGAAYAPLSHARLKGARGESSH